MVSKGDLQSRNQRDIMKLKFTCRSHLDVHVTWHLRDVTEISLAVGWSTENPTSPVSLFLLSLDFFRLFFSM